MTCVLKCIQRSFFLILQFAWLSSWFYAYIFSLIKILWSLVIILITVDIMFWCINFFSLSLFFWLVVQHQFHHRSHPSTCIIIFWTCLMGNHQKKKEKIISQRCNSKQPDHNQDIKIKSLVLLLFTYQNYSIGLMPPNTNEPFFINCYCCCGCCCRCCFGIVLLGFWQSSQAKKSSSFIHFLSWASIHLQSMKKFTT